VEVHQKIIEYLPIVGDTLRVSPYIQLLATQQMVDIVASHEGQHVADDSSIGAVLGSQLESDCKGKYLNHQENFPWSKRACLIAWAGLLNGEVGRIDPVIQDAGADWDSYPRDLTKAISPQQFQAHDSYVQGLINSFLQKNTFCPFAWKD
jgi:hypothetical protein